MITQLRGWKLFASTPLLYLMGSRKDEVAKLSARLHEELLLDQMNAKAPKGMAKCPKCGAIFSPTKNGRIRKHLSDPYDRIVCEMSGKPAKTA